MYLLGLSDVRRVHMHLFLADVVGQLHVMLPGGTKRNHLLALDQLGILFIHKMVTTAHLEDGMDISIVPATHTRLKNKHT